MITSMPAIPVRRERNKKEGSIGYFSRPHKLSLHFRPPISHHQVTPTPSPINSPQGVAESQTQHQEAGGHGLTRLIAQKRIFFQLSVLFPLAGALLLFIGLIQLIPGAEGKNYGGLLIVLGTTLLIIGLVLIIVRMFCKWQLERYDNSYLHGGVLPEIKVNEPSLNDVDLEKVGGELETTYGHQSPVRRASQQSSNPATTSFNNRTNTAALEQVHVSTSGAYSKSSSGGGGGGGGGGTSPSPNLYNPLKYGQPIP